MLVILHQTACKEHAERVASDLRRAFSNRLPVSLQDADSADRWRDAPSWDDLLIVIFKNDTLPRNGVKYIEQYQETREGAGMLLPIAVSTKSHVPPKPIHSIKAFQYDAESAGPGGRLAKRVGAMLHLSLQGRNTKIFLSHRSLDGANIAAQLEAHLTTLGYRPWLDAAKDLDGDTKILPGSSVQKEINAALAVASLVLLIDTPEAQRSLWIKHEVDTANGMMIPILPICFRDAADRNRGSRFPALRELQRYETLPFPTNPGGSPLTSAQLNQIVQAAEEYLCEILQRKCRVPHVVKDVFKSKGYDWSVLDQRRLMYRSQRKRGRVRTAVLSHCSIFHQIYTPALQGFREYLQSASWANYPLFIYDGEILPQHVLDDMIEPSDDDRVIVLNHQELAELVHSHFAVLDPPA